METMALLGFALFAGCFIFFIGTGFNDESPLRAFMSLVLLIAVGLMINAVQIDSEQAAVDKITSGEAKITITSVTLAPNGDTLKVESILTPIK